MVAESFERCSGYVNLRYDQLGPRIYLRPLASYYTLTLIVMSLVFGWLFFGLPSLGLMVLSLVSYIVAAFRLVSVPAME